MPIFEINHPLIKHKLTHLRKVETSSKEFREYLTEITSLMGYEIFKDLQLKEIKINTPIKKNVKGFELKKSVTIVPILRAGLGMEQGLINLLPSIKVGHLGLYRDKKTYKIVKYFSKLPKDINKSKVIIVDPMLATGSSLIEALKILKKIEIRDPLILVLVASPEGIKAIESKFPHINIYTAAIDKKLNSNKYIEPGLGDAGDRIFGTK